MNKYQEAITVKNFDILQEACDKADKYDKLAELFKSYNVYNYNELENILKNRDNNKLAIEDLYTIIRSLAWLDSSLTMPDYEYITNLINKSRKEYMNNIK